VATLSYGRENRRDGLVLSRPSPKEALATAGASTHLGLSMYVTYFDEVKADPAQGQNSYWIGGICVSMDHIAGLEA
jgi:hypothetical protein